MKRLFLLSLLVLPFGVLFGQKIQGVYVGQIFSERNALILNADGNQVTGAVYVSENAKFNFRGTYNKPELKGAILLDSSKKISVEGSLKGNSLSLTLLDSSEMKVRTVHKVSPKIAVDMGDLFSTRYDMLLLGVWETIGGIYPGNENPTGGVIHEYSLQGNGLVRFSGSIRPPANRNYSAEVISRAASSRWRLNWETRDGLLDETVHVPDVRTSGELDIHYTRNYIIKNDTLFTKSHVGYLTFWKRRK